MERSTRRLTYAKVTSTLALVIALTGGVAVAADKIDGKNIKKGTVTGKQIKDGSLNGADVKAGTVNAGTVDGRNATCPAGTTVYASACWDLAPTAGTTWYTSAQACAARGGALPEVGPLGAFATAKGLALTQEWVNDLSYDASVPAVRTFKVTTGPIIANASIDENHGYRCVIPLVH